jgi:hypothetical protein
MEPKVDANQTGLAHGFKLKNFNSEVWEIGLHTT